MLHAKVAGRCYLPNAKENGKAFGANTQKNAKAPSKATAPRW